MKIAIASDHGGYVLKETILGYLLALGHDVVDLGTNSSESVDYPEYGFKCGELVSKAEADRGIVICGTGIGISIAANKIKGIRCALCTTTEMAELTRKHNNSNILALGGRILEPTEALSIVETWLETDFEGGRHQKRVDMLDSK